MQPNAPLTDEQEARIARSREALDAILARALEGPPAAPKASPAAEVPASGIQREPRDCETCGAAFSACVWLMGSLRVVQRHCERCVEAHNRASNPDPGTVKEAREKAWLDLCPAEYQATDESKVRFQVGEQIVNEVLGWDCRRGLGLVGQTGHCKTRLMFLMLRARHMAGAKIRAINAVNFADQLADAYGRGSDDAERWMRAIERAPLLFIDDLGKEKITERVETFYYRLTEYRTSNGLPIFFTSNLTGPVLQKHWDDAARRGGFWTDRASAIVRRLKERCKSIAL